MPGTPTTRLSLVQPVGADAPSELRIAATANAVTLDDAAMYKEGTFASRGAANSRPNGTIYRCTDTGQVSVTTGTIWLDVGGFDPPVVSSLPGAPFDGQVVDYLADGTNGVVWRFRYRSASASTHKWEFVGGAEWITSPAGSTTTTSPSIVALSGGPSITIPLSGDYVVTLSCFTQQLAAAATSQQVTVMLGGVSTGFATAFDGVNTGNGGGLTLSERLNDLAAAGVLTLGVATSTGTNTNFANGTLNLRPIRVG